MKDLVGENGRMSILYLFFFLSWSIVFVLFIALPPPRCAFRFISIGLLFEFPDHHDVFPHPLLYMLPPLSCFTTIFVYVYLNHRRKKKESLFPWIHCCNKKKVITKIAKDQDCLAYVELMIILFIFIFSYAVLLFHYTRCRYLSNISPHKMTTCQDCGPHWQDASNYHRHHRAVYLA